MKFRDKRFYLSEYSQCCNEKYDLIRSRYPERNTYGKLKIPVRKIFVIAVALSRNRIICAYRPRELVQSCRYIDLLLHSFLYI